MAQRALPAGAVRRRAAFGLLDADGWTWAGLKAAFWFLVIIFMIGYIPNFTYYFTVENTVKVGYNFASIVNLCPAENEHLPCPAPAGAVLPWQTSPPELALPEPRTGAALFQSGPTLYLIGGSTSDGATSDVLVTETSETGNLSAWREGPALPEPRSQAALGVYTGIPYVVGGLDENGAPTDTVFKGIVKDGLLEGWELADGQNGTDPLTLPQPLSDASIVPGTSGFALIGGRDADGKPVADVRVAWVEVNSTSGRLLAWQPLEGLGLPAPRADATATKIGNYIYVVGGDGPDGVTDTVFRLEMPDREPATDETGRALGWAIAPADEALPSPRAGASTLPSGTALYVIGGVDDAGQPQDTFYWVEPNTSTGNLDGGWVHLTETDLPYGVADAPGAGVGATGFLFGGTVGPNAADYTDGLLRAGLAPAPPFFQLGIAGATIPALSIKGEIGQQLGYLNAMGVGMLNFAILVLIGVAFSHQAATRRLISRLSRGRLNVPPEDEYGA